MNYSAYFEGITDDEDEIAIFTLDRCQIPVQVHRKLRLYVHHAINAQH